MHDDCIRVDIDVPFLRISVSRDENGTKQEFGLLTVFDCNCKFPRSGQLEHLHLFELPRTLQMLIVIIYET